MSKSYNKDVSQRFHEKMQEDQENLLTVTEIKKIDESQLTKQAQD